MEFLFLEKIHQDGEFVETGCSYIFLDLMIYIYVYFFLR